MAKVKAAGLFIINKKLEVLICHPTHHPQDVWSIPKGKIEEGEEPVDAAIRETFEETNIDVSQYDMIHTLEPINYASKKKMLYPFLIFESQNDKIDWINLDIKCNSNVEEEKGGFPEMDDFKWVSIDEAIKVIHETQAITLGIIKEGIETVRLSNYGR